MEVFFTLLMHAELQKKAEQVRRRSQKSHTCSQANQLFLQVWMHDTLHSQAVSWPALYFLLILTQPRKNKTYYPQSYCSFTKLHCAALNCNALHCTVLHCTALHCTADILNVNNYANLMFVQIWGPTNVLFCSEHTLFLKILYATFALWK